MSCWRILIVEDWPDLAELEADIVRMAGNQPTVAASGDEALNQLAKAQFDLLLLDLDFYSLSGQAILDWMCEESRLRSIPVVIVADTIDGLQRTSQIVDVLPKPFEIEQLETAICRGLARCTRKLQ